MDTDEKPDLRRGGELKLLLKAETEKLIGFSFEVLNEVGHGLSEKIYENSLVVLFSEGAHSAGTILKDVGYLQELIQILPI